MIVVEDLVPEDAVRVKKEEELEVGAKTANALAVVIVEEVEAGNFLISCYLFHLLFKEIARVEDRAPEIVKIVQNPEIVKGLALVTGNVIETVIVTVKETEKRDEGADLEAGIGRGYLK